MTDLNFRDWLAIATKGLPKTVGEAVAEELEAHYSDYVKVHLEHGKTQDEAHLAALQALGDPMVTRRAFQQIHLPRKTYLSAAFASIFPVLAFVYSFLSIRESSNHGSYEQFEIPLLMIVPLCMIYTLYILKRVVNYGKPSQAVTVLSLGLLGFTVSHIFTVLAWRSYRPNLNLIEVYRFITMLSAFVIGFGLVGTGKQLTGYTFWMRWLKRMLTLCGICLLVLMASMLVIFPNFNRSLTTELPAFIGWGLSITYITMILSYLAVSLLLVGWFISRIRQRWAKNVA